jgi:hypothetical protein
VTDLAKMMAQTAEQWAILGSPAICERFVLRNGRAFAGRKLPKSYRRGKMKQCYSNSADLVSRQPGLRYVEGFAMRDDIAFAFQHAWAIDAKDRVIDITLDRPGECQYVGVVMSRDECWAEMAKTGFYGVMDTGVRGINVDWMYRVDPELKAIVKAIVAKGNDLRAELMRANRTMAETMRESAA